VQAALDSAFRALRTGGTVVNIAAWERAPTVNVMEMIVGEKKYMAIMTYVKRDFEDVLEAVVRGELTFYLRFFTCEVMSIFKSGVWFLFFETVCLSCPRFSQTRFNDYI